jgi:uncharacterized protein (DUF1499 family)
MASWIGTLGLSAMVGALALLGVGQAGGLRGQRPPDLGVHDGRLKRPSDTPNSVSSQAALYAGAGADYARIAPLAFRDKASDAMERLQAVVASMPGVRLIESRPDYLYAEFTTRWLKFVDDVEFFAPPGTQTIELRSASRLGRKDLGVNRARIEAIRTRFDALRPA